MRISQTLSAIALAAIVAVTPAGAAARDWTGCKTGTKAQNIATAKNFYKAYNTGDAELLGRTLADDFVSEPVTPGQPTGVKAAIDRLKFTRATFGPMNIENVDFIADGNKVAVRSNITATNTGPFLGVTPTGKTLKFGAIDIHTICNGRIVLGHHEENWMAVMFQLGVLPVKQ